MVGAFYDRLRSLSPYRVRRWVKLQPWFRPLSRLLLGSRVYSEGYFRELEALEAASIPAICDWIVSVLHPQSAIDVGCGPGHLMAGLRARGVDVHGVDISEASLKLAREKGLQCSRHDLTKGAPLPGGPYDLVVSCEVAEHLEERFAKRFLEQLTLAAPMVFLTAAEPQGAVGLHHYNEQPNSYWIALMDESGFCCDGEATAAARAAFEASGVISYLAKPMIFRRNIGGV